MIMTRIATEERLCQFVKQYVDSLYCLEILRFFGGYPYARFSELAVVHALNSDPGKLFTKRAIRQLVDKGLVRISTDNDMCFYSLTEDESLSSLVTDLARLDWPQWRQLLRQALVAPMD